MCTIFDKFYMIFQSELFCFLREADNPLERSKSGFMLSQGYTTAVVLKV